MQIFNHSFISLGGYTDEEKEAILRLKKRKLKPILKNLWLRKRNYFGDIVYLLWEAQNYGEFFFLSFRHDLNGRRRLW